MTYVTGYHDNGQKMFAGMWNEDEEKKATGFIGMKTARKGRRMNA